MSGHAVEIILASAGTGKTFQLTNRFLQILSAQEDAQSVARAASRILATTFTRKAAGEIRNRVLERAARGALDADAANELRKHVNGDLSQAKLLEVLEGLSNALPRLRVLTIDSMLVQMVTRASQECGLPDRWRLGADEEDETVRDRAIDVVLSQSDPEALYTFLHTLHHAGYGRSVHEEISRVVNGFYEAYLQTKGDPDAWSRVEAGAEKVDEQTIERLVRAVRGLEPPLTKAGAPSKPWVNALASVVERIEAGQWESLLDNSLVSRAADGEFVFSRTPMPEAYEPVLLEVARIAGGPVRYAIGRRNAVIYGLISRFAGEYQSAKAQEAVYTFGDMSELLEAAMGEHALLELRYQLDGAIDHAMLDEFQDTSVQQFRILKAILDELVSSGGGRSVFVVGDVKQSLYGWRNAERDLLPALKTDVWPFAHKRSMSESYRSSPVVMQAVNEVFEHIRVNAGIPSGSGVEQWAQEFEAHRSAEPVAHLPGAVRLLEIREEEGESTGDAEARLVAERVERVRAAAPGCSVAVIVRTTKVMTAMIDAMRARGIDAVQEGGSPLTDSHAAAIVVSLVHLAEHPADSATAHHIGTSPIGAALGIADPGSPAQGRALSARVRRMIAEEGCAAVCAWVRSLLGAGLEAKEANRLEQLADLAAEFDGRGEARLSRFVEMVEARRFSRAEAGSVRVMTVHGSKGLEFDYVVLADLEQRWQIHRNAVLTHRPDVLGPIDMVSAYPNRAAQRASANLAGLHDAALQREISEQLNVLYVGMTRAKHALEMLVPAKPAKDLAASRVLVEAFAVGEADDDGVLYELVEGEWTARFAEQSGAGDSASRSAGEEVEWGLEAADRVEWRSASGAAGEIEAGAIEAEEVEGSGGRLVGTVVHRWMELIDWVEDGLPEDGMLREIAREEGLAEDEIDGLIASWSEWLGQEHIARVLARPGDLSAGESAGVRHEWGFVHRDSAGAYWTGFVDRLVVRLRDGAAESAEIIDYKTDRDSGGGLRAKYEAQLGAYVEGVARTLGIAPARVIARLVYLRTGEVVGVGG